MTAKNCVEYQQFLSYMYILIFKLIPCSHLLHATNHLQVYHCFFWFRNPDSLHCARQALSCSLGMQKKPFVSTI